MQTDHYAFQRLVQWKVVSRSWITPSPTKSNVIVILPKQTVSDCGFKLGRSTNTPFVLHLPASLPIYSISLYLPFSSPVPDTLMYTTADIKPNTYIQSTLSCFRCTDELQLQTLWPQRTIAIQGYICKGTAWVPILRSIFTYSAWLQNETMVISLPTCKIFRNRRGTLHCFAFHGS